MKRSLALISVFLLAMMASAAAQSAEHSGGRPLEEFLAHVPPGTTVMHVFRGSEAGSAIAALNALPPATETAGDRAISLRVPGQEDVVFVVVVADGLVVSAFRIAAPDYERVKVAALGAPS